MELGFGMIAELFGGTADVGEGVLDVAFAGGAIDGFGGEVELVGDGSVDLVEGMALAGSDIEDAAGGDFAGGGAGEKVGADGVFDEVEVAAGKAVAEDGGGFASHHLVGELRDDAGVGRVGGLAGAEDVEVAEADPLKTIGTVEGLDVVLAGELLDGVGREGAGEHVFLLGLGGLVSVGRGGGGVDDAADTGVAGGDEEVQGAVDVGLVRGERVFDGAGNGGEGSLMEDVVDAFAGGLHAGGVLEVHLLEGDVAADVCEVVEIAGGEIVDSVHFVALFDERVGQGRADETCNSSDK